MAENRNTINIKSDESGEIKVADEVVAIIAGLAATEVEGVSSMAGNITNEIVSRLGMKNLSKGIQIEIADNEVVVDVALNIQAYEYTGYASQITDMKSYFEENMKLLDEDNREALFKSGNSIYTKIRDDNPTRYINGSKAKNVMVADGCVIEGTVENSILSRGVKIGKNAKVKNCILLQDTVIEDGANLEYVITDKNVRVSSNRSLTGNDSFQVYVAKGQTV